MSKNQPLESKIAAAQKKIAAAALTIDDFAKAQVAFAKLGKAIADTYMLNSKNPKP